MPRAAPQIGIIGRFRDTGNYCLARLYQQRLELLQWKLGKVETLATAALPPIREGEKVRLTARFAGRRFEARLASATNDVLATAAAELRGEAAPGLAGLRAHAGASPVSVAQFELRDPKGALLAAHQATMVIFLSTGLLEPLRERLLAGGYRKDTPAAIVYKATWPDEKVFRGTVDTLPQMAKENNITKTALILVGDFLGDQYDRSKLYDPAFTHEFREASK
jgi:hypothetical protein